MKYPTITLHQPWASWICWGLKTIETRRHDRFASLKGQRIAIHAGQAWSDHAFDEAAQVMSEIRYDGHNPALQAARNVERRKKMWGGSGPSFVEFVRGAILCLATVEDVRALNDKDNAAALCFCSDVCAPSLTGLILTDVEPLSEPGNLGG